MKTDFLVVGSGIAGANFALNASRYGQVLLLTKKRVVDTNTNFAQGGIASVLDEKDNFSSHLEDTLVAGSFHNDKEAVEFMVKEGPKALKKLISLGVRFSTNKDKKIALTKEGGHSHRRIAFCKDKTGQKIEETLVSNLKKTKKISILENAFVIDLIVEDEECLGVTAFIDGKFEIIFSKAVTIATGGCGTIFEKTTNPDIATGDGLAMAIRAGVKCKDLEFIQFHPTVLNLKKAPCFLLSEALRGEGAYIVDKKGERFLRKAHPLAELAPRDIVAREVFSRKEAYLDISHQDPSEVKDHFPTIFRELKKYDLDLTKDKIPISPASHYACGGILVDIFGRTSLKNLLAYGEVACTGIHGANRLASNSLLEAVVFSDQINKIISEFPKKIKEVKVEKYDIHEDLSTDSIRDNLRKINWKNMGLVRTEKGLIKLLSEIEKLLKINKEKKLSLEKIETENMLLVSRETARAALKRKESLGTHFVEQI